MMRVIRCETPRMHRVARQIIPAPISIRESRCNPLLGNSKTLEHSLSGIFGHPDATVIPFRLDVLILSYAILERCPAKSCVRLVNR